MLISCGKACYATVYEQNISTTQEKAQKDSWVFRTDERQNRTTGYSPPQTERTACVSGIKNMFAKKDRLPIRTMARKQGRVHRTPWCVITVFPSARAHSRFAVMVGKKVFAGAVQRNAARRMIIKILERVRGAWPIADYLVSAHPSVARATEQQLYECFISSSFN